MVLSSPGLAESAGVKVKGRALRREDWGAVLAALLLPVEIPPAH